MNIVKIFKSKKLWLVIIAIALIIGAFGLTYAALQEVFVGEENKIKTGIINFNYNEPTSDVSVSNDTAITDDVGIVDSSYFEFDVNSSTTGKTKVSYIIYVTPDANNEFPIDAIKVGLTKTNGASTAIADETLLTIKDGSECIPFDIANLEYNENANNFIVYQDTFDFSESTSLQQNNYRLRIWIDEDYYDQNPVITNDGTEHTVTTISGTFSLNVNVYGYSGDIKNVATNESCFTFDETTQTITNYTVKENCTTNVVVPSKINGINVLTIGDSALKNKGITSVIFSEGIENIGNEVLKASSNGETLNKAILPSTLKTIGDYAFSGRQLKEIDLPNGLTTIGNYAFSSNSLTSLIIPSTVTSIGDYAFSNNKLSAVTIKGKTSTSNFTSYGTDVFGWIDGYSDSNILWD